MKWIGFWSVFDGEGRHVSQGASVRVLENLASIGKVGAKVQVISQNHQHIGIRRAACVSEFTTAVTAGMGAGIRDGRRFSRDAARRAYACYGWSSCFSSVMNSSTAF